MASSHSHDACETSEKYTGYIESHLQRLRSKCESLTACIQQLLLDESTFLVLKGEDISLNKTCGLVSKRGFQGYQTQVDKCTTEARQEIHDDIEHHLKDAVTGGLKRWGRINKCLENSYGDKERLPVVDKFCRWVIQILFCQEMNTDEVFFILLLSMLITSFH
ncbi:hypothetical protein ElyMa_001777600 [Elysia marginata]|uniref:Uncharacterized protein n=1 Tax=Elysia marginata TaxID=1093978 RepID=A0AAV4EE87_9GAST|nr:hypothetical protein ElyMa_001777600 [Elysia marginata]